MEEVSFFETGIFVCKAHFDQYELHCANPLNTSIAWLGLFYSIMSLSARFYECEVIAARENYRGKALGLADDFHHHAAQCLDKIDMSHPIAGTVEFVSIFLHTLYFRRQENSTQMWLLFGDCVRLAMRMGYHRDPASYPHFTPFECEMRRRVWLMVINADLLFSFQLGLPTIVRHDEYDTMAPRNYFEHQLYPGMRNLPAEQPPNAPTFISYWIASDLLLRPFRCILEEMNSLIPMKYDRVLALSLRLTSSRSQIAPHLRHETADAASDNSTDILKRIQLDQAYHKVMCVLHRKHMAEGLRNPQYRPSTDACIQSALALLRCQEDLHSKEMTLFRQIRWDIFSLTNHDFLLAATILCLYLALIDRSGIHALAMAAAQDGQPISDRATIEHALARSRAIWSEVRTTSEEANKAYNILEMTVSLSPFFRPHPATCWDICCGTLSLLTKPLSYQLSRRDQFLHARNQVPVAPEPHVAVDPAIAQMQPQNGALADGIEFDPTFDWVSAIEPVNQLIWLKSRFSPVYIKISRGFTDS